MGHINAAAVRGAIVERLEGHFVGVRSVDPDLIENTLFEGADDGTKITRSLVRPSFLVSITEIDKHPDSPMGPTSMIYYSVKISIKVTYHLEGPQLNAVSYDDSKAVAEDQADIFAQALTWPGALLTCEALGQPTRIMSGCLQPASPLYRVLRDDPKAAIFETEHNYSAIVLNDDVAIS